MPIFVLLLLLAVPAFSQTGLHPFTLGELAIDVPAGASREIGYTNKQAGVFYTETNGVHRSGWQGWRIMSTEMMESYLLAVDGAPLRPADALGARAMPHQLCRTYAGGVLETVTLLDSIDALVVELRHPPGSRVSARPLFTDGRASADFETVVSGRILQVAKARHRLRTPAENFPAWLTVLAPGEGTRRAAADTFAERSTFSPGSLTSESADSVTVFLFVWGDSPGASLREASHLAGEYLSRIAARKERMERLLNASYVRTGDARLTRALQWAKLSLDALLMHQIRPGIFAGLPWFDNYWGRDTFIALPGAALVTGNFEAARDILRSFAAWQSADIAQPTYGRIPNLVTTASIGYNTADGTPRFIAALDAYVRSSGDTAMIREMYPVLRRSIDGTVRYHTDALGFLTHADAETWMDAVGPAGAWTPRGDRANDLQALWADQLAVGIRWATLLHDRAAARAWTAMRATLLRGFRDRFIDAAHGVVFDHLNADGTPDPQFRPNQLFTLDLLDELRAKEVAAHVFDTLTRTLVYPYGVGSLSPGDNAFHPYHHYAPYYVQDAAYHNGIVWTWLAGAWVDRALAYDFRELAATVTAGMVDQILDRGAIGTLSELLDAAPRPGESFPRLSGTYSQAWSLAEFVRNFYEGYLGVRADVPGGTLTVAPRLAESMGAVEFRVPFGKHAVLGRVDAPRSGSALEIRPDARLRLLLTFRPAGEPPASASATLQPLVKVQCQYDGARFTMAGPSGATRLAAVTPPEIAPRGFRPPPLAVPSVRPDLPALRGPSHRMLSNAEVKRDNPSAAVLLDAEDPQGDDVGNGSYRYPTTTSLKPGSLDLRHCRIAADSTSLYVTLKFANLSDPGWHPEYGFQLTYVAIAVDEDGVPGSGKQAVGMNAQYYLPAERAYERIVYIGGGVRLDDTSATLAEYLPQPGDEERALGDVASKSITFSLPLALLGRPTDRWHYTILVGAQDDHGGAGIGEFRAVGDVPSEWSGGGKKQPADSNVFDVLSP